MLVYVSHPIDRANEEVQASVDTALEHLERHIGNGPMHLFKPGSAFSVGKFAEPDASIELINQAAQEQAKGMIVIWPEGAKSWGVPVEVERAIQRGIPVAFMTNSKATWANPGAWLDSTLFGKFQLEYDSMDRALIWIADRQGPTNLGGIPTKFLSGDAKLPSRAYVDDAGFDLYISEDTSVKRGQFVDVPCAVAVELPSDTWALLTGRSSTLRKHNLMVNQGVIDPGYRGELFAGVMNLGKKTVHLKKGDRVAQLILMHNKSLKRHLVPAQELKHHPRGESSFGSSGR